MIRTRIVVLVTAVALGGAVAAVLDRQARERQPTEIDDAVVAPGVFAVPPLPDETPATVLAAGDIAECDGRAAATGALLADLDGVVAAVGDLAYPDGSAQAFAECYDPTWGHARERTRPALGNHDVQTPAARGYFDYFDRLAGPAPHGFYGYDLGAWHVVVLNSNCGGEVGCDEGSAQYQWLRDDLATSDTGNILAYWHHPRHGVGARGDTPAMDPLWDLLHGHGGDVVISAHDHSYQRFAPLDAEGNPARVGQRQFVVGTGGANLRRLDDRDRHSVQFAQDDHHGILRLDLHDCGYSWRFLPADGGPPLDTGHTDGTC